MALAGLLVAAGLLLDALDLVSAFANMPEVQAAIAYYAGPYGAHALKLIGLATAAARMRSLTKGA